MTFNADPNDLLSAFLDMRTFWVSAEIEAQYGLSRLLARMGPMSAKERRRADIVVSRDLARAADRRAELAKWLEVGYGPTDMIRDILPRIDRADATWRKMLTVLRAIPVTIHPPAPFIAINHPNDLPGWLQQLDQWARPESEIIADLKDAIEHGDARSDEALDHVQWSAEDDLEAVETVLHRAAAWNIPDSTRAYLQAKSGEAIAQLKKLIDLVEKARPFSQSMQMTASLALLAKEQGQKPH